MPGGVLSGPKGGREFNYSLRMHDLLRGDISLSQMKAKELMQQHQ